MKPLKDMQQAVVKTLRTWGYEPYIPIIKEDMIYALYLHSDKITPLFKWHAVCLAINDYLIDCGDGIYCINGEML